MSDRRLEAFVGDALRAGRTREEIDGVLARAGWAERDRARAVGAWSEERFDPPVPQPPSEAWGWPVVLYLFLFGLLATLAIEVTLMARALVDIGFLDAVAAARAPDDPEQAARRAGYIYGGALRAFRWGVAALLVLGPVLAWLVVLDRRRLRAAPAERVAPVRALPAMAILAAACATFLGAAMTIVYQFLTGDPQAAAMLKLLIVAAVAGLLVAVIWLGFRPRG